MLAKEYRVTCSLLDEDQVYEIWAVSAEHARKMALCAFLDVSDMPQADAQFVCLVSTSDLVRIINGLQVVSELVDTTTEGAN